MINITEFYPLIQPHVCGAPNSRIKAEVLTTLQDVLTSTHIWRESIPVTSDGSSDVVITHPAGRRVLSVIGVKCNGVDITGNLDSGALSNSGDFIVTGLDVDCDGDLEVLVSYTVTVDATQIPDNIWYRYRQIIIDGARARLHSQINRPWGDGSLSALSAKQYSDGLAKIKGDVAQGYTSVDKPRKSYKLRGMP